jgi:hypothetical protein
MNFLLEYQLLGVPARRSYSVDVVLSVGNEALRQQSCGSTVIYIGPYARPKSSSDSIQVAHSFFQHCRIPEPVNKNYPAIRQAPTVATRTYHINMVSSLVSLNGSEGWIAGKGDSVFVRPKSSVW